MRIRNVHPGFWRGLGKELFFEDIAWSGAQKDIVGENATRIRNLGSTNVTAWQTPPAAVRGQKVYKRLEKPKAKPTRNSLIDREALISRITFVASKQLIATIAG